VAAALMLSGCQSGLTGLFGGNTRNTIEDPGPELPAGQLYNEGLAHMNGGKFKQAVKSFEEVDRQHPYSEYARKALVMSAFANYRAGNDDEAVEAANRFLSLYPASEDAAYAHYIIGQSYFRQVPDVTRDQDATRRALASMQEIVTNYPDSEYARDAREKILAARDQLAGKEMQIGRYYLERRDYIAAINRFRVVVTEYQNTRHIEEALYRLTEANLAMGLSSEAQTAAAVLGHNYPDSQWYKDAYNLLQGGGLEPNENPGSWIARAFGRDVG
jgi:outer membrane protein assembly factor BamD